MCMLQDVRSLYGKRVVLVTAHPDDEIVAIFVWMFVRVIEFPNRFLVLFANHG